MFALTTILWQLGLQFFRYLKQSEEMNPDEEILLNKLKKLQDAIEKDDIKKTKEIIDWFHQNLERNKQILTTLYTSDVECTTQTDIIVAACQSRNADMLDFILYRTDILLHLSDDSFDDTEANKQRTEVFRHALRSEKFAMVRMLYLHWCGNWPTGNQQDKKNVEMIGNLLKDAIDVLGPDTDLHLQVNCQYLIKLNGFHCEACTELAKLKQSDITPKETAAVILRVLRVYHRYSHLIKADVEDKEDKSSLFRDFELIMDYEDYFQSIDLSISLIILVNLNILRKHLKNRFNKTEKYFRDNPNLQIFYKRAAETYKEFESEIYYFIYRIRLLLRSYSEAPEKMQTGIIDLKNTVESKLVRYLERKNFRRNLKKIAKILRIHVIRRDPAENGIGTKSQSKNADKTKVVPLLDENYLQTIRYMRDHYSLVKIVFYIEVIETANDLNVLMIERVLHVIGEMLKSTDDSYHLSRPTLALLQMFIPVEIIRHLNKIRDFLSKAGHLSTRIDMANTQPQTLFNKIKEVLINIKRSILFAKEINMNILGKSIYEKSYHLLERQIKRLPEEGQLHIKVLCEHKVHIYEWNAEEFYQFYREVWEPIGLSVQLLNDICYIEHIKDKTLSNIQILNKHLTHAVAFVVPAFIKILRQTLKSIIRNNNRVHTINQQLSNYDKHAKMRDCPDGEEINRIRNKAARLMKRNKKVQIDMDLLNEIRNYIHNWNCLKDMINFCLIECDLFAPISHLILNEDSLPDIPTVEKVNNILVDMEAICVKHKSRQASKPLVSGNWWQRIYRFFSNWVNWTGHRSGRTGRQKSTNFDGIEKLIGNFNSAQQIKQDDPRIERDELISCLIKRLDLLKQTLLYPQRISCHKHVQRFKHDVKFRLILEMIIADIANVLVVCNIRLMKKSSSLLREIDLGNVLDHGNPFLDLLNYYEDFATELLEKAMMFAEDGEAIEALYELFKGNVGYDTIKAGDHLKMDARQQRLYEKFKKSPNWESYANLTRLPKFKPKIGKKD